MRLVSTILSFGQLFLSFHSGSVVLINILKCYISFKEKKKTGFLSCTTTTSCCVCYHSLCVIGKRVPDDQLFSFLRRERAGYLTR